MKASITNYNGSYRVSKASALAEVKKSNKRKGVCWTHFQKLPKPMELEKAFNLHPLVVEDITMKNQRPKIDSFKDYLVIIVKKLSIDNDRISSKQFSIVLKKECVISYSEDPAKFKNLRDRMQKKRIPVKNDYLAYAILDAIVDEYFEVLEQFGEKIEALEDDLFKNPSEKTLKKLHRYRREVMKVRSMVWPLREVINEMARGELKLIQKGTLIHLRDLYDHAIQVIETIENYREMLSGMLDIYLSSISNKMNEVMKVLTVISTIFIPLTFITGLYGMNFKYMPELSVFWAYPAVWVFMIVLGTIMAIYFRRKGWL